MKRYTVLKYELDTRANVLSMEISDDWEESNITLWKANKRSIREGLIFQYGTSSYEEKIKDFMDMGSKPISVIAFHNEFFDQIRSAFVVSAYYPALTAACALGERILNQLIIHLRDEFKDTPQYKRVYKKNSFDDWNLAIKTLEEWDVLLPDVAVALRSLKEIRHRSIHFDPEVESNTREKALDAILKLSEIIQGQFSIFGSQPWFIPGTKVSFFIKKAYEKDPFVKNIILPCCSLVGHMFRLEREGYGWLVIDTYEYEEKGISDDVFADLFNNRSFDEVMKQKA